MFPSAEDVRRSAKVALILRAGRGGSNPAPGRQVHPDAVDFWGLPAGTTITPGMRRLTAAQREQFQALSPEQRARYFEARRTGTHAAALKALKPEDPLKRETARVTRVFQPYTSEQRASHQASHRLTPGQKNATGEYFYTHPDVPNIAFKTRGEAARRGLAAQEHKTPGEPVPAKSVTPPHRAEIDRLLAEAKTLPAKPDPTGPGAYVPRHVRDVQQFLAGEREATLPLSVLYRTINQHSYEAYFTPEQRRNILAQLRAILPVTGEGDRRGVESTIRDLEAIDAPSAPAKRATPGAAPGPDTGSKGDAAAAELTRLADNLDPSGMGPTADDVRRRLGGLYRDDLRHVADRLGVKYEADFNAGDFRHAITVAVSRRFSERRKEWVRRNPEKAIEQELRDAMASRLAETFRLSVLGTDEQRQIERDAEAQLQEDVRRRVAALRGEGPDTGFENWLRGFRATYGFDKPAPTKATPAKATPAPVSDQRIAEAERRAARTRERATKAQAAHDAAARPSAQEAALAKHFPLGTGGAHGGRPGASDAQLRKFVETRKAAEAAQVQARRAERQATELAARRDAAGKYSRDTVAAGDYIKVKGTWERVLKANDKTVQVDAGRGLDVRYRWDQVTDHRSAESVISVAADRAGLTGTERSDFIAWAKRNPGKTVADWQAQRRAA